MTKPIERIDVSGASLDRLRKLTDIPHEHYEGMSAPYAINPSILDAASDKITRLIAELEQAREDIRIYKDMVQKAGEDVEQSEQQVAVLVAQTAYSERVFKQILSNVHRHFSEYPDSQKSGYLHALCDIADEALSTLPDRAKKIQVVVEAAKEFEYKYNNIDSGPLTPALEQLLQTTRDLKEIP